VTGPGIDLVLNIRRMVASALRYLARSARRQTTFDSSDFHLLHVAVLTGSAPVASWLDRIVNADRDIGQGADSVHVVCPVSQIRGVYTFDSRDLSDCRRPCKGRQGMSIVM
jgi:hypothetical protein